MQIKYGPKPKANPKRRVDPETWLSGPTAYERELFYAWHKHRAQAHYRKEEYNLTYEDWRIIWHNPDDFLNRGRKQTNVVLTRIDRQLPWSIDNCQIQTRYEHLLNNTLIQGRRSNGQFNDRSESH